MGRGSGQGGTAMCAGLGRRTVEDMTTTASTHTGLDRFFEVLHRSPIVRSDDRVIAGVCGSVAARLGVSAKAVRIAAVVLAFFGPAFGLYLAAWLLIPDTRGRVTFERAVRGGEGKAIALTVVAGLVLLSDIGVHHPFGWFALAVTAIVLGSFVVGRGPAGGRRGRRPVTEPYAGATAYVPPTDAPTYPDAPAPQGHVPPQDAPRY